VGWRHVTNLLMLGYRELAAVHPGKLLLGVSCIGLGFSTRWQYCLTCVVYGVVGRDIMLWWSSWQAHCDAICIF
jgi:hypothetical protein